MYLAVARTQKATSGKCPKSQHNWKRPDARACCGRCVGHGKPATLPLESVDQLQQTDVSGAKNECIELDAARHKIAIQCLLLSTW
jgi:hypothetical protein